MKLRVLLVAGCILTSARAQDLAEQLFAAARQGDTAAAEALLAKGVDVNAKARYDRTALSFAAHRGHVDLVKVLLARGADPNVKDTFYGSSPLMLAASEGHYLVVRALLDKAAAGGEELLMNSVFSNRAEAVQIVLEKGGVSAETLTSALAAATRLKRTEIAALLEKAGAKPPAPANFPVDAETLKRYQGRYRSDRGMEYSFAVTDGKLTGGVVGGKPVEHGAVNPTTFRPLPAPEETITFDLEGDTVTSFTSRRGPIESRFVKVKGN